METEAGSLSSNSAQLGVLTGKILDTLLDKVQTIIKLSLVGE